MDPENAKELGHEFKHMLTRAMGVTKSVQADVSELQCFKGDILVIGSDGLTEKITKEEIHEIVAKETPAKACQKLVDLSNQRMGGDNVTVIVLKIINTKPSQGGFFKFLSKFFS
jgi:protein phosphatase